MPKPRIRCPACGSSQVYIRIRTAQIVCPKCGEVSHRKEPKPSIKLEKGVA